MFPERIIDLSIKTGYKNEMKTSVTNNSYCKIIFKPFQSHQANFQISMLPGNTFVAAESHPRVAKRHPL